MKFRKEVRVMVLLMVLISMIAIPITVHAEPIYIETLDITVNTKDEPTKAIVVDNRGVLTPSEIEAIEHAGERLKVYNLGVYIEMTDSKTCTQNYAVNLAEEKYREIMPNENSILIAYSFYEDANGYFGVYYNVQGDVSRSEIQSIISGTYHDFETDGTWIAGSTDQVVDYLEKVESDLLSTDARMAEKKKQDEEFLKSFRVVLMCLGGGIILLLIVLYRKKDNELWETERKNERKVEELLSTISKKDDEIEKGLEEVRRLNTWKRNAISADPDIERKIKTFLAYQKAKQFDSDFGSASTLSDYVSMFDQYGAMSDEEKSYVQLDMVKAKEMLDQLAKIEAEKANSYFEETCKLSSNRANYESYNNAVHYYNGLPSCVRTLLNLALIHSLTSGHSQAQSDYKHHQAASSYHSYHSSSSSSRSYHSSGGFHSGSFGGHFGGGH